MVAELLSLFEVEKLSNKKKITISREVISNPIVAQFDILSLKDILDLLIGLLVYYFASKYII